MRQGFQAHGWMIEIYGKQAYGQIWHNYISPTISFQLQKVTKHELPLFQKARSPENLRENEQYLLKNDAWKMIHFLFKWVPFQGFPCEFSGESIVVDFFGFFSTPRWPGQRGSRLLAWALIRLGGWSC